MKNPIMVIILMLALFIAGCGKKDDSTTTTKTQDTKTQDVKKEDSKKDTSSQTTATALPDIFPKDMPLFPGLNIVSSNKNASGGTVSLQAKGKLEGIGKFFKTEMKKNGYKADDFNDKMMKDYSGILTYDKDGNAYTISYNYLPELDKTTITYQVRFKN